MNQANEFLIDFFLNMNKITPVLTNGSFQHATNRRRLDEKRKEEDDLVHGNAVPRGFECN